MEEGCLGGGNWSMKQLVVRPGPKNRSEELVASAVRKKWAKGLAKELVATGLSLTREKIAAGRRKGAAALPLSPRPGLLCASLGKHCADITSNASTGTKICTCWGKADIAWNPLDNSICMGILIRECSTSTSLQTGEDKALCGTAAASPRLFPGASRRTGRANRLVT